MAHYFVAESVLEKHRKNVAVALGMAICTPNDAYFTGDQDLLLYPSKAESEPWPSGIPRQWLHGPDETPVFECIQVLVESADPEDRFAALWP
jgi:hypothetical protein